jgi:hypothetical protein
MPGLDERQEVIRRKERNGQRFKKEEDVMNEWMNEVTKNWTGRHRRVFSCPFDLLSAVLLPTLAYSGTV